MVACVPSKDYQNNISSEKKGISIEVGTLFPFAMDFAVPNTIVFSPSIISLYFDLEMMRKEIKLFFPKNY